MRTIDTVLPRETIAQSDSTPSGKPKLSTMERGHHTDVPLRVRLCALPIISLKSNSVRRLYKSLRSCVKVEVADLGYPSLIGLRFMWHVDVKQRKQTF